MKYYIRVPLENLEAVVKQAIQVCADGSHNETAERLDRTFKALKKQLLEEFGQ